MIEPILVAFFAAMLLTWPIWSAVLFVVAICFLAMIGFEDNMP